MFSMLSEANVVIDGVIGIAETVLDTASVDNFKPFSVEDGQFILNHAIQDSKETQ